MSKGQTHVRFTLAQRIEHLVTVVTFVLLALTGLPQMYADTGAGRTLIALMGGIEFVRVIHRVAATALMLEVMYHLAVVSYKVFVQRSRLSMLPGWQDVSDAWNAFLYNLGRRKAPPPAGRYTFGEKAEYWAFVWGTAVMVVTGFMLWNPIATTVLLPGQAVPAALAAHGGEALLAVLAIIVWHMYHVHVRRFNKSIFTGRITEHEMVEEHPRELADIQAGVAERPVPPAELQRRRGQYLPVAAVLTLVLLVGVYRFVTFEETALATVDRGAEPGAAFDPLTPTPLPTPRPTATAIALRPVWDGSLEVVFQTKCLDCHGGAAGLDVSTYALLMQGSRNGPIVIPGDPDQSPVVLKMVKPHPGQLSEFEMQVLREWITAGAPQK